MDRRQFLKLCTGSVAAVLGAAGCASPGEYTEADATQLAQQVREEAERSGRGPHGELRFRGYRGLAELPYFDLGPDGQLRLAVEGLPPAIDFHTHLGMNFLFAPQVDLLRRTARTQYFLDCDRESPGCMLDLDVYINTAFTPAMHDDLEHEVRNQLLFGSAAAATQTIPNLIAEMDAVGCAQAAVLPIAAGLPFGDDLTNRWLEAVATARVADRLIPFASVHPCDRSWRERLHGYARRGARGLKVHPEMQRVFPDAAAMLPIYEACEQLGLPVIFHAGRSGIEPEFVRKYALIRRYRGAVAAFPRVQFVMGHAGARDVADAVALAREHGNVWLEITGQGVTQLDAIVRSLGSDRLLFGSDWPFYPLAATLAKVLIVTERQPAARASILRDNALRVFAAAAASKRPG